MFLIRLARNACLLAVLALVTFGPLQVGAQMICEHCCRCGDITCFPAPGKCIECGNCGFCCRDQ